MILLMTMMTMMTRWSAVFLFGVCLLLLCQRSHADTDVEFDPWGDWTECTQTCGYGVKMRHRLCPKGLVCQLAQIGQLRRCKLRECPIDGGWGSWSSWRLCSQTCGEGGVQRRIRVCNNPQPQYGGNFCSGSRFDTRPCGNLSPCPVHGGWSEWGDWGPCSARLCRFKGNRYRSRNCTNPAPAHGGSNCEGRLTDHETCSKPNCPVHGGWSSWSNWTECSSTCGSASFRTKTRQCDNPTPVGARAKNCTGTWIRYSECPGIAACPDGTNERDGPANFMQQSSSSSTLINVTEEWSSVSSIVIEPTEVTNPMSSPKKGPVVGPSFSWSESEESEDSGNSLSVSNSDSSPVLVTEATSSPTDVTEEPRRCGSVSSSSDSLGLCE